MSPDLPVNKNVLILTSHHGDGNKAAGSWVNGLGWRENWMINVHTGLRHSSSLMGEQRLTKARYTNRREDLSRSRNETLNIVSFSEGETEDVRELALDHPVTICRNHHVINTQRWELGACHQDTKPEDSSLAV